MLTYEKNSYDEKRKNIQRNIQNLIDFNDIQEEQNTEETDVVDNKNNNEEDKNDNDQADKHSLNSLEEEKSLDTELTSMIKMLVESLIPFNLVHSSFYSNWLDYNYKKFRRPRLIQMINMFETMYQLSNDYIKQTLSGSSSYTLAFEFWKCGRKNYISLRASYMNVFENHFAFLTCFKVFHDWSEDKFIDKISGIFKYYGMERKKVFLCVTNFRSKNFIKGLESYFGEDKVNFCLIHQLNTKITRLLLDCDYEDDIITNKKPLTSTDLNSCSSDIDENIDDKDVNNEAKEMNNKFNGLMNKLDTDSGTDFDKANDENDDGFVFDNIKDEEFSDNFEEKDFEELDKLFFDKKNNSEEQDFHEIFSAEMSIEEYYKSFQAFDTSQKPLFLRIIYALIKSFTYMVLNENELEKFDSITLNKNGSKFKYFYLYAIKNWNNLYSFLFYFRTIKEEFLDFVSKKPEYSFEFKNEDLEIIEDLFSILVVFKEKMNLLSLQTKINLGKSLQIFAELQKKLDKEIMITSEGNQLKDEFLSFFKKKISFMQKDLYYGVASLLDPECSSKDFETEEDYKECISVLHKVLCFKLDEKFNFTLYKIRKPLEIEVNNYLRRRPVEIHHSFMKFQLSSPVLKSLANDYLSATATCMKPLYIHNETKEQTIVNLKKIREDSLEKILKLNSIDQDFLSKIIEITKFWN